MCELAKTTTRKRQRHVKGRKRVDWPQSIVASAVGYMGASCCCNNKRFVVAIADVVAVSGARATFATLHVL